MKKYKLTKESKEVMGRTVYRIEALKDFDTIIGRKVKKGDKGGWVESEDNLSHEGTCWLFDEAVGMEGSRRSESSVGHDNSRQFGNSQQSGDSRQYGNSQQYGDSWQYGNSRQFGDFKHTTGLHFASKHKDWDISEVEDGEWTHLISGYKPALEETPDLKGKEVEVKLDGKTYKAIIQ